MRRMTKGKLQCAKSGHINHHYPQSKNITHTLLLVVLICVLFACSVPGDPPEVTGTIVSVEAQATKSGALRVVHVRLDDNRTVRATAKGHGAVQAGGRVVLSVTKIPVLGFEQLEVKSLVEEQKNP